MPFTIIDILYSGLLPAVVALAVWILARRVLKEDAAARYAPALSLAVGFSVGYWLLWSKDADYWMPKFAYDWLAVVVALTAIWGPIVHARGVSWFERLLAYLLFGLIAAWFLVPDRPKLEPVRFNYILGLGSSLALIAFLLDG